MLLTCSPHRQAEQMLPSHSSSPEHHRHHALIQEIRRSLSRSPSRAQIRSPPIHGPASYSPSPLSPSRKTVPESTLHIQSLPSPHPRVAGNSHTSRVQRPSLRRTAQAQGSLRGRTSPKSPFKRFAFDEHKLRKRRSAEIDDEDLDMISGEDKENSTMVSEEHTLNWKTAQTRQDKRRSGGFLVDVVPLSPMKRSDATMNLDQPNFGSPSAKRRSLHAPPSWDFSVFESDNLKDSIEHKRAQDDHDGFTSTSRSPSNRFSTLPQRTSSLRKSTIQQRQTDRGSPMRLQLVDFTQNWPSATPAPNFRKPVRASLDNHLGPVPRDSPFATPGPLLNSSIHPAVPHHDTTTHIPQNRHPLANTFTQPSTSEKEDDSPTHGPSRRSGRTRSHDFSKSLPVGALRPVMDEDMDQSEQSSQGSFATPSNYKAVKPLPAAFMSTGLISKKNRNLIGLDGGLPKSHMPDTPCKRQSLMFPPTAKGKSRNITFDTGYVGTATPRSPTEWAQGLPRAIPLGLTKNAKLFPTHARQSLARKASFASLLSIDGEDKNFSQGSTSQNGSQSTEEYPPTPSKQLIIDPERPASVSPSPRHPAMKRETMPSVTRNSSFASVGPHLHEIDKASPHTPLENIFPPDPSTLSISGKHDRPRTSNGNANFPYVPATPTGPRDYFPKFSHRPSLNLNVTEAKDIDPVLLARFDKVSQIGTGEFSSVFRVTNRAEESSFTRSFSVRPSTGVSPPDRVYAVKKSRYPYQGPRDRAKKVHEADILKTLGQDDHVVNFVDCWEDHGYLYIQTEFCEEGTLATFLMQSGWKARLDDFRIWKILLELSLGIKHIHQNNIVHLDLKPANILITFEGVLKIADFGMATRLPAQRGIEGEGDKEYIAPEVLKGNYDKPADIFALGLILLETAGNIVLPDAGTIWRHLREGNMEDCPSLTFSSADSIPRDETGEPLITENDEQATEAAGTVPNTDVEVPETLVAKQSYAVRNGELVVPPDFMTNSMNPQAINNMIQWMILADPQSRPVVDQVLAMHGVEWVASRRRAGATIFEGNWGPADEVLAEDAEMIDV